ncbi:M48 family metallopeptidase [Actinomadura kijaniata]|uniref:M48 family metallopeptidase n=1 Tax=Actinomadura kijaniata TaxID=46161 RepID=UPI000A028B1B|nr:M48 family metallopeptidase [Actinomadura kijaniata]
MTVHTPPAAPLPPAADARRPRVAAAVTAGVLLASVAVILAVTTPWDPLSGHVPGGRTVPDPALDFSAAELARARAFDAELNPIAYTRLAVGLLAVLALGLTPLGARFLGWATARGRRWPLRVALAAVVLTTVLRLVGLPFGIWGETVLRRYGLSTQTWGSWLGDQARSLAVTWVVWSLALLLLYALLRRFPRYWWTGAAVGAFLLVVGGSFVYPVVVEPVFNKFHSLPAGRLRSDLLAMADRDGVPVEDVLVADASRRTTSLNAYVSGFGSTRRIVVYDTLLKSPPARIESIVAHELGHAKHRDVLHGTLIGGLGVAGAVCLLSLLLSSPRLARRSGTPEGAAAADARSVALVLALVTVATQLGGPVQNFVSRRVEARADAHALDLTRDPATFVSMQHELSARNLSDPRPNGLERLLWSSHPPGPERIAMARDWAKLHGVPVPPPLNRR